MRIHYSLPGDERFSAFDKGSDIHRQMSASSPGSLFKMRIPAKEIQIFTNYLLGGIAAPQNLHRTFSFL
jgi:hypothetical protein